MDFFIDIVSIGSNDFKCKYSPQRARVFIPIDNSFNITLKTNDKIIINGVSTKIIEYSLADSHGFGGTKKLLEILINDAM